MQEIKYFLSENKMNQTKLESLRNAISMGTYNVEQSEISHADAGYILTVEIISVDEPIDFIAFTDLINSHGCIIVQVTAGVKESVVFFIEEKLESGY
jgi:hypothetical protein